MRLTTQQELIIKRLELIINHDIERNIRNSFHKFTESRIASGYYIGGLKVDVDISNSFGYISIPIRMIDVFNAKYFDMIYFKELNRSYFVKRLETHASRIEHDIQIHHSGKFEFLQTFMWFYNVWDEIKLLTLLDETILEF